MMGKIVAVMVFLLAVWAHVAVASMACSASACGPT